MNKKQKILNAMKGIKKVEDTSEALISLIKNIGVYTGSTYFKINTDDSDIDIIMPPDSPLKFGDVIGFHHGIYLHENKTGGIEHYFQEDFDSLYVIYKNNLYNLLFMHNELIFKKWVYATRVFEERMTDPYFKEAAKDKKFRVSTFERFKREFIKKKEEENNLIQDDV